MRVLFAGTPEIAVPTLRDIHASAHSIAGILSAPDRPRGRGRSLHPSPVAEAAAALDPGIPVLKPDQLRTEAREAVSQLEPEILVCFAYGKIFGPRFLGLFSRGGVNVHPSLLPRFRGPAPIPAAILGGDDETGITVQELAREMDTGAILLQERIRLDGTETSETLGRTVAGAAGGLVVRVLDSLDALVPQEQDHRLATYTRLVEKADGVIDWSADAATIERTVRAYDPWPRATTSLRGERLAVLAAAVVPGNHESVSLPSGVPGTVLGVDKELGILVETGNGPLALQRLHLQSRKPLDWRSFLNGVQDITGTVLGGT